MTERIVQEPLADGMAAVV